MKNFSSLCLLAALSTINFACGKNSEISKIDLITVTGWKIDDSGLDQNKDGNIDATGTNFYPCLKDNAIAFNKDKTGTIDEGSLKCYPFDPQSSVINWELLDAEKHGSKC